MRGATAFHIMEKASVKIALINRYYKFECVYIYRKIVLKTALSVY